MSQSSQGSGLVTALATVGMVFGLIGLLGSFIPCLGVLAMYVSFPAIIAAGIATWLAYSKRVGKGLPIAALTISIIGFMISYAQYAAMTSSVHK
jgi:hypothetical protein